MSKEYQLDETYSRNQPVVHGLVEKEGRILLV
jgi:hypothetical protein